MRECEIGNQKLKNALQKIGVAVRIQTDDGVRNGTAAIYPIRQHQVKNKREGRYESADFLMFGCEKLLDGVKNGDIVFDENNRVYTIIWVEKYACRTGAYIRAMMKQNRQEK